MKLKDLFFVLSALFAVSICASEDSVTSEGLVLHAFVPPQAWNLGIPRFPSSEMRRVREAWVRVHFMVDLTGTPNEIEIVDSMGNRAFEIAAISAIKKWKFVPASYDGEPVVAGATRKVIFILSPEQKGASASFISSYKSLIRAVGRGDQKAATGKLASMKKHVRNLYEYSWLALGEYSYMSKWGSPSEQLRALESAIAYEVESGFLPDELFVSSLISKFVLETELNYFRKALNTFNTLLRQESFTDAQEARLSDYVGRVKEIGKQKTAFAVSGVFDNRGQWSYELLWNKFAIQSNKNQDLDLKLLCDRRFVGFEFINELVYKVEGDPGKCTVFLQGKMNEGITLVQI